jgi:hypothetical protein
MVWGRFAQFGQKARMFGATCALAGTPLLFYLLYGPFFSHPVSFAVSTAFLVAWDRTRGNRSRAEWLLLGLLLGFAALIRPQNLSLGIVILAEVGFEVGRAFLPDNLNLKNRRAGMPGPLLGAFLILGGALLAFSPQLAAWKILYGSVLALPKIAEMHWSKPDFWHTLMSDYHGIIPWTPLTLIAAIGLIALAMRDASLAVGLALAFAAQVYLNAANEVWWSGGSFGNRRMADVAIIAAYGMAALWEMKPGRTWKITIAALGGVCCFWTLCLLLAERTGNLLLDHYVPFSGAEFWRSMAQPWIYPGKTAFALFGPLRVENTTAIRAIAATGLCVGIILSCRFSQKLQRVKAPRITSVLVATSLILFAAVFIGGLRTPLPPPYVVSQISKKPGVLWDNYIELAQFEGENENSEAMETAARKAIAMRPDQYSGFWYLGIALGQQERWKESADAFSEVLRLNPQHARAAKRRDAALANLARETQR